MHDATTHACGPITRRVYMKQNRNTVHVPQMAFVLVTSALRQMEMPWPSVVDAHPSDPCPASTPHPLLQLSHTFIVIISQQTFALAPPVIVHELIVVVAIAVARVCWRGAILIRRPCVQMRSSCHTSGKGKKGESLRPRCSSPMSPVGFNPPPSPTPWFALRAHRMRGSAE